MKIGALAQASGTPVDTIRYYEREGLLPAPARSEGNFRQYQAAHLERLQFIRHCRGLDMSLDEVRQLLRFRDNPDEPCADVNALLDAHIDHVSRRMAELRVLEAQLRVLRDRCDQPQTAAECGILCALDHVAQSGPVAAGEPGRAGTGSAPGSHGGGVHRR